MNSPIYPIYITNIQLLNLPYFQFFSNSNTDNDFFFNQSLTYSAGILYPSLTNCLVGSYSLYQTSINPTDSPSDVQTSCNLQKRRGKNPLNFSSTKSFQNLKECKFEAEIPIGLLKKQQAQQLYQNQQKYHSRKLRSKNKTKKILDTQYVPNSHKKKDSRRRFKQNQNRNVIPNEINQIISFLQKRAKSQALLKRVWAKYPPPSTEQSIDRFYLLQTYLKEKIGHYSNETSLKLLKSLIELECNIWPQNQQRHYIMLSRVLIGHFLCEDSIFSILTSKRMKSDKKLEHLRARRVVTFIVKQQPKAYAQGFGRGFIIQRFMRLD